MEARNREMFQVIHANTERLKKSAVPYIQRMLNQGEDIQNCVLVKFCGALYASPGYMTFNKPLVFCLFVRLYISVYCTTSSVYTVYQAAGYVVQQCILYTHQLAMLYSSVYCTPTSWQSLTSWLRHQPPVGAAGERTL